MHIAKALGSHFPKRTIAVLEYDSKPFQRASHINQARVHNGYHYPRSLSTAIKSAGYYNRFLNDFNFAINKKFQKIYAISENFSHASAENFSDFCKAANIPCEPIHSSKYFKDNTVEAAFVTDEYSMDGKKICNYFGTEIGKLQNVELFFNIRINAAENNGKSYVIDCKNAPKFSSEFVINTSYASVNQILNLFDFDLFDIKYEIAELILCDVNHSLKNAGLTVMDGPFFSLMPFGLSGKHSLSAVHHTPHKTSNELLPTFKCQKLNPSCSAIALENCNLCPVKPNTKFEQMKNLAMKYLKDDSKITYKESLFAIKPILKATETTDARPTIVKEFSSSPRFVSVLSGKFNTMYDLDDLLLW